ncbi:MAG: beta-lactamase family protein [Synergistaceae bacterium]|jgi:CubicO group peptidase (beta-lactamase class C family)|nr:beta-lactamase family protein [Synergistaceae bacterium]
MSKLIKIIVNVLVFCILISAAGPAAEAAVSYSNTIEAARDAVWKTITSGKGSSATVAVMDGGKIVYSEGFGSAERKTGKSVDRSTRFNIGSTSKMFVATAILLLADEGKVSIDEPVVKYIPEFEMKDRRYRDITVRMLFNHSSGLPGSTFIFGYEPEEDPYKELLQGIKGSNLKHDPGSIGIYCNDGFTLAEMMVERVSGRKFIDFLRERVFLPLGMKDTGPSIGETGGNISHFYDPETGKKYPPEMILVHAAGGLSSTAEDLCRFGDSFCPGGKKILSQRSIDEILDSQPTPFSALLRGPAIMDSFGWDYSYLPAYEENGIKVYSKNGGTGAYSTGFQVIPEKRLVVAASISGNTNGEIVTRAMLDALMKDKGLPVPTEKKKEKPVDPEIIPSGLTAFEGIYANGGSFVKIRFDKERKKMDVIQLIPEGDKELVADGGPVLMSFVYNGGSFFCFEKDTRGYFIKNGDISCFIAEKVPFYGIDALMFQKLSEEKSPKKLFADITNKVWLIRNMPPSIQMYGETPIMTSNTYKELPGHLTFFNPLRIVDENHATYAAPLFRDQYELEIYESEGTLWISSWVFLFSDAEKTTILKDGQNTVMIGEKGYNEWYKTGTGSILSFDGPEKGRIMVFVEDTQGPVFDSIADKGGVYVPEGSYVVCIGRPGDILTVNVK